MPVTRKAKVERVGKSPDASVPADVPAPVVIITVPEVSLPLIVTVPPAVGYTWRYTWRGSARH